VIDLLDNRPACADHIRAGGVDLWFSDDPDERAQAAEVCATCPVALQCSQDWRDGDVGVWGGLDHTPATPKAVVPLEDRICPKGHVGAYKLFKDRSKASGVNAMCVECSRLRARASERLKRRVCPRGHKGKYKAPKGKPGKAYCRECKLERIHEYRANLTTGCHLHFTVTVDGSYVDPERFLSG
jgi:hypothetical protein